MTTTAPVVVLISLRWWITFLVFFVVGFVSGEPHNVQPFPFHSLTTAFGRYMYTHVKKFKILVLIEIQEMNLKRKVNVTAHIINSVKCFESWFCCKCVLCKNPFKYSFGCTISVYLSFSILKMLRSVRIFAWIWHFICSFQQSTRSFLMQQWVPTMILNVEIGAHRQKCHCRHE